MRNTFILHHYEMSPYAEKIRLMFGLTGSHWYSSLTSVQPPRPGVDPLAGGYRRVPVAQVGADVFCDTALIAQEIAEATATPALDPANMDDSSRMLVRQAEQEAFFAAIGAVPPVRLLGTMLKAFGPLGMYRFAKDRASMMKGGTVRPPKGEEAKARIRALVENLEACLAEQSWVAGESASVADFAVYHPLWLHLLCNRKPLDAGPEVREWYQRVAAIGHGQREEISAADAFAAARETQPRALPEGDNADTALLGKSVEVAPCDYALIPVTGTLVAYREDRIVVARDTSEFGVIHNHFPRSGYAVTAK
ncbi:MAG: glutathione S-transferase family protein [Candidatus Pelagadaptatus aseana]|uniref:glutathione S-transferase family protein n=1 Tax=Candidatus Pelagadaptatus aseana TaxID=3120508 RepID=UPI0039B2E750